MISNHLPISYATNEITNQGERTLSDSDPPRPDDRRVSTSGDLKPPSSATSSTIDGVAGFELPRPVATEPSTFRREDAADSGLGLIDAVEAGRCCRCDEFDIGRSTDVRLAGLAPEDRLDSSRLDSDADDWGRELSLSAATEAERCDECRSERSSLSSIKVSSLPIYNMLKSG